MYLAQDTVQLPVPTLVGTRTPHGGETKSWATLAFLPSSANLSQSTRGTLWECLCECVRGEWVPVWGWWSQDLWRDWKTRTRRGRGAREEEWAKRDEETWEKDTGVIRCVLYSWIPNHKIQIYRNVTYTTWARSQLRFGACIEQAGNRHSIHWSPNPDSTLKNGNGKLLSPYTGTYLSSLTDSQHTF